MADLGKVAGGLSMIVLATAVAAAVGVALTPNVLLGYGLLATVVWLLGVALTVGILAATPLVRLGRRSASRRTERMRILAAADDASRSVLAGSGNQ
jgi:hypothetical protein